MIEDKGGISTGSTLLNLALTENPNVGFLPGHYYWYAGSSESGKTFFSMACFAESTINETYQNYRLIYDNVEDGMLMDCDKLFNEDVSDRVEPPTGTKDDPRYSITVEDFYYNLDDAFYEAGWDARKRLPSKVRDPRPFIYVLDSENSLDSVAASEKFHKNKQAHRKSEKKAYGGGDEGEKEDEKIAGSYGDGKAKKHSEFLRKAMPALRRTKSILIIVSQTRDDIGSPLPGAQTTSGGRALKFYATAQIMTQSTGNIIKTVLGKSRKVGTHVKASVRKSRHTGKHSEVEIDIFPSHGIDDVGDCVDYLIDEDVLPKKGEGKFAAFGTIGGRDKIIKVILRDGLENDLKTMCTERWAEVQAASAVVRKNRYAKSE